MPKIMNLKYKNLPYKSVICTDRLKIEIGLNSTINSEKHGIFTSILNF